MFNLDNLGRLLSEQDVAMLERRLPSGLPHGYRRFLLHHNGGTPQPDCVDVPGFGETDVQVFYGIGRDIETSCIQWNIDALNERLDAWLVPIACDSGGNVFCLSLRPNDNGAVIYCDLDSVFADFGKPPPMYPVAADFDNFLSRLRPFS